MRLHEYQAKAAFREEGILVPQGSLASSPEEARDAAARLGGSCVVKAQILVGGRGKAGGVGYADSPDAASQVAAGMLSKVIRGSRVDLLLVEDRLDVERELYVGVTVDGGSGGPVVVLSPEGGVDIETTALGHPEMIVSRQVDILQGLRPFEAREMVRGIGLRGDVAARCTEAVLAVYGAFLRYDALIAEINPLVVTRGGDVVAADAVIEVDDSAIYRHPDLDSGAEEDDSDPLREEGRRIGVSYVGLSGDIGVICSGAGLGMATIDAVVRCGGRPANFLETGGAITGDLMARAFRLVLMNRGLKGVLVNIYGGINPIHEGAKGIAQVMEEDGVDIPVFAKALGNFQEQTWEILEAAGVVVVRDVETEALVERLLRAVTQPKASGVARDRDVETEAPVKRPPAAVTCRDLTADRA